MVELGLLAGLLVALCGISSVDLVVGLREYWEFRSLSAAEEHLGWTVTVGTRLVLPLTETILKIIIKFTITFLK